MEKNIEIVKAELIKEVIFANGTVFSIKGEFEEGFIIAFEEVEGGIKVDAFEEGWGFYSRTFDLEGNCLT